MNQNMNVRLMPLLVGLVGLLFALFIGKLIGESNLRWLEVIFGGLTVIVVCLWLRSSIWLLIPFCWALTGRISVLPLPFSVRDLSVMLVTAMFGIFFALKIVRFKSAIGWLEVFVGINVAYVAFMFIRHPVGTSAFGSTMVGGRPYFDVIIGTLAFLILRFVTITPRQARIFPFFLLAGSLLVTGLNLLVRVVPGLVSVIAPLYSGVNVQGYLETEGYQELSSKQGERLTELAGPGGIIIQILCSYNKPLSLLLPIHPLKMLFFFAAGLGLLLSGFRSSIISSACFFLFACYFHGGMQSLFRGFFIGFVGLLAVVVIQVSVGLPLQAQRALSFIPLIHWDETQKEDAEESTQWRVDMWKMVLHEKKYLNDKIWGDGFGFSAYELSIAVAGDLGGTGYIGGAAQEAFMVNGAFHSGPLSAIRFAGIVGLILYLMWVFYMAFQAPKMIRLSRGTPFFPTMIFFFMPMIYGPFFFIFIYGAYDAAMPDTLFSAGMFRMISNSLLSYHASLEESVTANKSTQALIEPHSIVRTNRTLHV